MEVHLRTRHQLALEMRQDRRLCFRMAGPRDYKMGRCTWFRRDLRALNGPYLLALPLNNLMSD